MLKLKDTHNPPWLFTYKVKGHNFLKDYILDYIETTDQVGYSGVSKVDFRSHNSTNPAPYQETATKILHPYLYDYAIQLGFHKSTEITITNMWFQQYDQRAFFNWHPHDKMSVFVYYAEGGHNPTEIFDPYNKKVLKVDAEEGDIIVYPSFIHHRSCKNQGKRKTVIAGNFNFIGMTNTSYVENYF